MVFRNRSHAPQKMNIYAVLGGRARRLRPPTRSEGIHSSLQRGGGVYLVAGGRGTEATVLLLSTSVLSVQSVFV